MATGRTGHCVVFAALMSGAGMQFTRLGMRSVDSQQGTLSATPPFFALLFGVLSNAPEKLTRNGGARHIAVQALQLSRADAPMGLIGEGDVNTEIIVHVSAETLRDDAEAGRCHIDDSPALPPEAVRRLACDAEVVRLGKELGISMPRE